MGHLKSEVKTRINQLNQVIQVKSEALLKAPEGALHIARTENRVQHYCKTGADKRQRKYIKNGDQNVIEALCQKGYDQKVLMAAKNELIQLERLEQRYPLLVYEDVYATLDDYRKQYVMPVQVTDEEYIRIWEKEEFVRKEFWGDAPEFYTEKGERVRSKTEILIANALYRYGIPYHYEKPLYLDGYGTIHPDFTVLNVRQRKEYYWEHMGIMDDADYVEKALQRIIAYEKNGYFPGTELVLTHETQKYPIDSRLIDKMICRYLM